jgi:hypothetical protein
VKSGAAPPVARDGAWPNNDVDRFIAAALDAKNLRPAAEAEHLRRRERRQRHRHHPRRHSPRLHPEVLRQRPDSHFAPVVERLQPPEAESEQRTPEHQSGDIGKRVKLARRRPDHRCARAPSAKDEPESHQQPAHDLRPENRRTGIHRLGLHPPRPGVSGRG